MRHFIIAFMALACILPPGGANAQVQLPQFSISNIPMIEMESSDPRDFEEAFAKIQSPLMRDTLRLQYQINLLETLIRRQTEIQRIADSYEKIGIPFKQPAPPQSACEQLPVNVLCMAFYPDTPKYSTLVEERKEKFAREQRLRMEEMLLNIDMQDFETAGSAGASPMGATSTPRQPDRLYQWTDIRCLAGTCSALLINRDDESVRLRVRKDEALPGGGTVSTISSSGITIALNGNDYTIPPHRLTDNESRDQQVEQADIQGIIDRNLGAAAADTASIPAGADAAIPPQAVVPPAANTPPPPMLGVTGLF